MTRIDGDALRRGMWPEAFVAGLATLSVAWPLTNLLREDTWLIPAIGLVLLVVVVGGVLRTLDVPASLVSLGQLLLGIAGITVLYLRDTLWRGFLPTQETLERVGSLLQQAGTVLQTYAAPAPTTAGVSFLVVTVLTLTAVSVDSMGVTGRAPASAGIPLAAGFLVSVSNSGQAMAPWFFAAVAGLWLVMLAQQGYRVTDAWPSERRRESRGSDDISSGTPRSRGLAQVLGVLALIAALGGALAIPHQPPTFFGGGLARNPDARQVDSDTGQVSFTETMDPSQDLRNQSQAPVLVYRNSATRLEPLRVTATERWEDGRWVSPDRDPSTFVEGALPPRPPGMSEQIDLTSQTMTVIGNELPPPHLAAPSLLSGLRLTEGSSYSFDPTDSTVVLEDPSPQFEATYLSVSGQLPGDVGWTRADPANFDADLLAVDPVSEDAITALAQEVVGDENNSLSAAILIQNHLRRAPYTYSLELAPAAEADADDPIGGFLETRQGYCVQFATAMVMMARQQGIPARMAVGFLPGTSQPDGTRRVVAADAHTWPELWISGMGWTRFEPTPGFHAGQPPAYARSASEADTEQQTTTITQTVAPDPTPTPTPTAAAPPTAGDRFGDLLPVLGRALLVVLVIAALMALVPFIGRRYREEGLRSATSPEETVEGQWIWLTRSLQDLGVEEPPERSPRDMRRHYDAGTTLNRRGEEALGRITATLERSRYAAPDSVGADDAEQMGQDAHKVVDQVRQHAPWNIRANALLLPSSGLDGVRAWFGRLFTRR
ncbi:transglutaminaseTgpA domain-containing protein [Ornithinimicrobium sp. Y1694]|uniref:transglutaminase family protein n=1 Tax=Ornithinimicrobium sp. Y1694 TaxID=3418590 RepID=UPI003CE678F5